MLKSHYQHLFFDLDRTLYDFDRCNRETLQDMFGMHKLRQEGIPDFDAFLGIYKGINKGLWELYKTGQITKQELNRERFARTLGHFGINHMLSKDMAADYIRLSPLKTHLIPGSIELLEYLKPKYHLHIITNGFDEIQFRKIDRCGLGEYFSHVITSEDAGVQKPDPGIFQYAFRLTGAEPALSLLIGDDPDSDVAGAYKSGMDVVWLAGKEEVSEFPPTLRITELSELKQWL